MTHYASWTQGRRLKVWARRAPKLLVFDNAKHHSAPCEERRRAKQWNIGLKQAWTHVSQGGKKEDNGDNDYNDNNNNNGDNDYFNIGRQYFLDLRIMMWHFREKRTRDTCLPQYFWCFSSSSSSFSSPPSKSSSRKSSLSSSRCWRAWAPRPTFLSWWSYLATGGSGGDDVHHDDSGGDDYADGIHTKYLRTEYK